MSTALTWTTTLKTTTCWCGIPMALPKDLYDEALRSHRSVYCPLGHTWVFTGKSDAEKLKEAQAELAKQKELTLAERAAKWGAENRAARSEKRAERLKKRASAGLCPFCNRSFLALTRHIHTKHPDEAHA